jgi:mono/diheme cytochrome c family protein
MSKTCVPWLLLLVIVFFQVSVQSAQKAQGRQQGITRGRYLVEEVARCWECHSPRDDRGEVDRSRWLQGGTVWFAPIHPVQNWAYLAPSIAGLGGLTEEQTLQVLKAGIGPDGRPVRPPMHPYHLSPEDAAAIVAYLKSLQNSRH